MGNPALVQFMHPGGEHQPDLPDQRSWNRGDHRRTFLRSRGSYIEADGKPASADVAFWGEWEPPVRVLASWRDVQAGWPRHICEPYFELPRVFDDHQNTDPCVFGHRF